MLHVISLGAGVQSTTMALMAAHGELEPMPDCAIFADTQAEPKAVYDHLQWLSSPNVLPFPVHVVKHGHLPTDTLRWARSKASGKTYVDTRIPAWVGDAGGKLGPLRRACTRDYKVKPIHRKIKELLGLKPGAPLPREAVATCWMGISYDEMQRMKDAPEPHLVNRWPLVERSMTRQHCLEWMERAGYPPPPRSACVFCPYHSAKEWRRIKTEDAPSWDAAVAFERELQQVMAERSQVTRGVPYLWMGCKNLEDVDWSDETNANQLDLFADECDGMCGV